ncbi:MAG TPA: hypothetical protein DCQ64_17130, partial [Candidatus Rokubacteria bacterium]|nr:hypothetical protein [Candidatus Rokubacteria bacterium]
PNVAEVERGMADRLLGTGWFERVEAPVERAVSEQATVTVRRGRVVVSEALEASESVANSVEATQVAEPVESIEEHEVDPMDEMEAIAARAEREPAHPKYTRSVLSKMTKSELEAIAKTVSLQNLVGQSIRKDLADAIAEKLGL